MNPSLRMKLLQGKLRDARGGRVAFVSHCLLNANARYLGGAGRSGVDGSPSCALAVTMGLNQTFECLAGMRLETLDRREMNEALYSGCLTPGRGLFMEELSRLMGRKGIEAESLAHDLASELAES